MNEKQTLRQLRLGPETRDRDKERGGKSGRRRVSVCWDNVGMSSQHRKRHCLISVMSESCLSSNNNLTSDRPGRPCRFGLRNGLNAGKSQSVVIHC